MNDPKLVPARGVIIGIAISVPFWIAVAAWWATASAAPWPGHDEACTGLSDRNVVTMAQAAGYDGSTLMGRPGAQLVSVMNLHPAQLSGTADKWTCVGEAYVQDYRRNPWPAVVWLQRLPDGNTELNVWWKR